MGWQGLDRHSKYGNTPLRCKQGTFHHSKVEARRCNDLHLLQAGGAIADLQAHPQPIYRLDINGTHICNYVADFAYTRTDTGEKVTEDVKGVRTEVYKLKARMLKAIYDIEVVETR